MNIMRFYTSKTKYPIIFGLILVLATALFFLFQGNAHTIMQPLETIRQSFDDPQTQFGHMGLRTNTENANIPLDKVLSGGPGKDGIPAINNPTFVSVDDARVDPDTRGVLVTMGTETRFYPYNILVWHEIVNDSIGDTHFAVTFCPLCGSAIVFDRNLDGDIFTFGVSGLLYESNLLMYDTDTESLWSQARGEAVIGEYTGTKLTILDMKLIEFSRVQSDHPDARVLSQHTGYNRNYNRDPYTGYGLSEDLVFPVSISDKRFPSKELFYVVPVADVSIAFPAEPLTGSVEMKHNGITLIATKADDGSISITADGESIPGYYEMWFSWATHHQDDGVVWDISDN